MLRHQVSIRHFRQSRWHPSTHSPNPPEAPAILDTKFKTANSGGLRAEPRKIASAIRLSASLSHSDRCSHGAICDGLYSFVSMQYVTHASRMRWPRNSRSSGDRKGRFDLLRPCMVIKIQNVILIITSVAARATGPIVPYPRRRSHTFGRSQDISCIMVPQFHVQRHQAAAPTILYDEFDIRNHMWRRQTLRGAFVQPSLLRWPLLLYTIPSKDTMYLCTLNTGIPNSRC